MQRRIQFSGTGGGLLVRFLGGMILTAITCGLYGPWFAVMLYKYVAKNTTLKTEAGPVQFEFTGTGGQLFGTFIVGYLLTLVTLGIYIPWYYCRLARFFCNNCKGTASDGASYSLKFEGEGGELFVTGLVGYLLTIVTVGIYGAWFMCKLTRFFTSNTTILKQGAPAGGFDFVGKGGKLLLTFLGGYLLTILTCGIYMFWFIVKMWKFIAQNTEATVNGRKYVGDFTGTGGELLVAMLVGYLLTIVTLGIYGAWFVCKLLKFELESLVFEDRAGPPPIS